MDFDFDYITTAKEAHATWAKRRKIAELRQDEMAHVVGLSQGRYSR
jgi:DNA-binding XRE family transcriptional regulator